MGAFFLNSILFWGRLEWINGEMWIGSDLIFLIQHAHMMAVLCFACVCVCVTVLQSRDGRVGGELPSTQCLSRQRDSLTLRWTFRGGYEGAEEVEGQNACSSQTMRYYTDENARCSYDTITNFFPVQWSPLFVWGGQSGEGLVAKDQRPKSNYKRKSIVQTIPLWALLPPSWTLTVMRLSRLNNWYPWPLTQHYRSIHFHTQSSPI